LQSLVCAVGLSSITMSLIALLLLFLSPFLFKKYSPKWQYYSWLVIIIGFIFPFRPHFRFAPVKVRILTIDTYTSKESTMSTLNSGVEIFTDSDASAISVFNMIGYIWIVGMCFVLGYHIIKHYRFTRMVKRWSDEVTDKQVLAILNVLKTDMGITKEVQLKRCPFIPSPMMFGFTSPTILLPAASYHKDELVFILKHELVHFVRKDTWYKCLVLLAISIHWFNPVVHFISKAINLHCELSCDQDVIGDADCITRQQYSETIIAVIRYQSRAKTVLSTTFYGGTKGMKKRIISIMDTSSKKGGITILIGIFIITIGISVAFTSSSFKEDKNESSVKKVTVTAAATSGKPGVEQPPYSDGAVLPLLQYDSEMHVYRYKGKWVRLIDDRYIWNGMSYGGLSTGSEGDNNTWGDFIDLKTVRNPNTNKIEQLLELSKEEARTILATLNQ